MIRLLAGAAALTLATGCASGQALVRVHPDGSWECEARGMVLGRATIAAVVRENLTTTPGAQGEGEAELLDACAAIRGGAGSGGVWATLGGLLGAAAGWLAAHGLW